MKEPRWIDRRSLVLLHSETLAEHGGRSGIVDEGRMDSALARPRQMFSYGRKHDLARLAAAYAVALVRNHPFVDGNKRAAFLAVGLFLGLNDFRLAADQADAARNVLGLAAGEINEEQFAKWVRGHMKRSPRRRSGST